MEQPLLPAWFVDRMMDDVWSFGLLTTTSAVICISCIKRIHHWLDGCLWLDVELLPNISVELPGLTMICAPTSERLTASVNASQIVAAFELANT